MLRLREEVPLPLLQLLEALAQVRLVLLISVAQRLKQATRAFLLGALRAVLPLDHVRVSPASLSACCEDAALSSLCDGGRRAGIDLKDRRSAQQEEMLSDVDSLVAVTSLLQSIDTGLGQGLIPLGKEDAIVDQLQLAHKNGLNKFEDKDGIYCVDIVNLAKFSGDPKYADVHEMLQRVDGLTNAGVSVSSGGGGQHGKSRVHFRQPREGRRTTPGRTQRHHLDTVSDKDVPEYVRKLWLADPLNRHKTP